MWPTEKIKGLFAQGSLCLPGLSFGGVVGLCDWRWHPLRKWVLVLRTVFPTLSGVCELLSNYKVGDITLTSLFHHQRMLSEQ